jgi:acetyl-CoA acetyltransferase
VTPQAVIAGTAVVGPRRDLPRAPLADAGQAVERALADAGLAVPDVDGLFTYTHTPTDPRAREMQRTLGIADLSGWGDLGVSGASGMAAVVAAAEAVLSGACQVAVAFKAARQRPPSPGVPAGCLSAEERLLAGYGPFRVAMTSVAMRMRRRAFELGCDPGECGFVAVNASRWAARNDRAARRTLLDLDAYAASRVVLDPLRLHDCDYPVDGAGAVVIARGDVVGNRPAVTIDALSCATGSGHGWLFSDDFLYGATRRCAGRLWERASFGPGDVDVGQVYDGFSYMAIAWLEALGLCPEGRFGKWVEGGDRIGPGGDLPVNTSGGQLAEGRLHTFGLVHEAVRQLRGDCGPHQVAGAATAVVTAGFGPQCAALALRTG